MNRSGFFFFFFIVPSNNLSPHFDLVRVPAVEFIVKLFFFFCQLAFFYGLEKKRKRIRPFRRRGHRVLGPERKFIRHYIQYVILSRAHELEKFFPSVF